MFALMWRLNKIENHTVITVCIESLDWTLKAKVITTTNSLIFFYSRYTQEYLSDFLGGSSGKSPHANAGNARDAGSIPGLGRSPEGGHRKPLQYSCLGIPWTEEPGRLQSTGLERVEHKWHDLVHTFLF